MQWQGVSTLTVARAVRAKARAVASLGSVEARCLARLFGCATGSQELRVDHQIADLSHPMISISVGGEGHVFEPGCACVFNGDANPRHRSVRLARPQGMLWLESACFLAQADLARAYNTVCHIAMWGLMRRRGMPETRLVSARTARGESRQRWARKWACVRVAAWARWCSGGPWRM